MEGQEDVLAPALIDHSADSRGAESVKQSSEAAALKEGEGVKAANIPNTMSWITREPPEGGKEGTEAQEKKDIKVAQEETAQLRPRKTC